VQQFEIGGTTIKVANADRDWVVRATVALRKHQKVWEKCDYSAWGFTGAWNCNAWVDTFLACGLKIEGGVLGINYFISNKFFSCSKGSCCAAKETGSCAAPFSYQNQIYGIHWIKGYSPSKCPDCHFNCPTDPDCYKSPCGGGGAWSQSNSSKSSESFKGIKPATDK
jgi:hypothetical protein